MDPLSFIFGIGAVLISFLIFTQAVDTELTLAVKAVFMAGLAFPILVVAVSNIGTFSIYNWLVTVIGTAVASLCLIAAVYIIPPASAITLPDKLFYANMAIVETIFLVYFIFRWLCTLFPWPAAAFITGLFFAPLHIGVYGFNLPFMVFAVIAMVIFCAVYYITGSLFTAMGAHIIFNLLASAASITNPSTFVIGSLLVPSLSLAVPLISFKLMEVSRNAIRKRKII
jgi:membrane protease YdiL (CAAX protease family)